MTTINLADKATGVPQFGTGSAYAEFTLAPDASGFDLISGGNIVESLPITACTFIVSKTGDESLGVFVCAKGLKPKTMYLGDGSGSKTNIEVGDQLIMLLVKDKGLIKEIATHNPTIDISKAKTLG